MTTRTPDGPFICGPLARSPKIANCRWKVCFVPIQIGVESGGGTADESERTSSAQARPLKITEPPTKVCGVSSEENLTECSTIL